MRVDLLKEKIQERGVKLEFIANKLELSKYGFSLKINGRNEFKWSEVEKIIKILKLTKEEKDSIFFK